MAGDPSTEKLRNDALRIFQAALCAVDPEEAVKRHLRLSPGGRLEVGGKTWDLERFRRVLVVGAGKATAPMAKAVEDLLGERVAGGTVVVKDGHGLPLRRIAVREAAHPVPDGRGERGSAEILERLAGCGSDDLVIALISGGASALLVAPVPGVSLAEKQETTRLLLASGATIHEMNTVRKHLSRVKGGGLARAAHPARLITLILSDVVGDDLDVIGSGPSVPDSSRYADAIAILRRYRLWERLPEAVRRHLTEGAEGKIPETPKPGDAIFAGSTAVIVGSCLQALEAAARAAAGRGYRCLILSSRIEGEAREIARALVAVGKESLHSGNPLPPPACLLAGGETTVTLRGEGRGGRNQELALAGAIALEGTGRMLLLSAGTDGTDGPTDAAGATADGGTAARARRLGLDPRDYLERNDSYAFFDRLGDLIRTGPTRTNVMDVYLLLVGGEAR
ncbi:MAG: glycerate kinase [Desulfobacterales bacterium]